MRLNFTANSFAFGRTNRGIAPRTFSVKLAGRELPKCVWTSQQTTSFLDAEIAKMHPERFSQSVQDENFQNASQLHCKKLRFWTHKSWNCPKNFFCKTRSQRTFNMRLNFTTNSFVFGCTNRGIATRCFSVKLAATELPKCVWTSRQPASFLDAKIEKMRPELFLQTSQGDYFQNASELHSKPVHFCTNKRWNCAQNFSIKLARQRTSKMRLNFTANNFVFGRKNRENAPRPFFTNLARRLRPKCVWVSRQSASFLDAKIGKMRPELFLQSMQDENVQNASDFATNHFILGHINRGIAPRTFSVKLAAKELPKCVWTSLQTASFFNAKIGKMRPDLFLQSVQDENYQKASELHRKYLCFWTQTSWKCAQNFFFFFWARWKPLKCVWTSLQTALILDAIIVKMRPKHFWKFWRRITQNMHQNFTANSFVLRRKNRENAPRTSL